MRGEPTHMELTKPENQTGNPDNELSRVLEHLGRAIGVFQNMTRQVEQGNFGPESENCKTIRGLTSATQTLYNEKQKIETCLRKQAGIAGGYGIDLDAARREVGRRMALLRTAQSDREVSE